MGDAPNVFVVIVEASDLEIVKSKLAQLGTVFELTSSAFLVAINGTQGEIIFALDPLKEPTVKRLFVLRAQGIIGPSLGNVLDSEIRRVLQMAG
jgi:hypothetical protein